MSPASHSCMWHICSILPIKKAKSCSLALFFNNKKLINSTCEILVKTQKILPSATHVSNGVYAVSTQSDLHFSKICNHKLSGSFLAKPPVSLIQLPIGCSAVSESFTLPTYFQDYSKMSLQSTTIDLSFDPTIVSTIVSEVTQFNQSAIGLWKDLHLALPNLTLSELPPHLHDIAPMPIESLIDQIKVIRKMKLSFKPGLWHILTISGFVLFGITMLLVVFKCRRRIFRQLSCVAKRRELTVTNESVPLQVTPTTAVMIPTTEPEEAFMFQTTKTPCIYPSLMGENLPVQLKTQTSLWWTFWPRRLYKELYYYYYNAIRIDSDRGRWVCPMDCYSTSEDGGRKLEGASYQERRPRKKRRRRKRTLQSTIWK